MTAPAAVVPASNKPARAPISVGARGVQLTTIEEMFRFSEAVVQAGVSPRGMDTPQKVFVAVQWGAELGLTPMQSIFGLPIVNGKPTPEVAVALALVLGSGLLKQRHERWEGEGDQRRCVVALVRRDDTAVERSFSIADAKKAKLDQKDNWKGFPDRMLFARAMGYALKDLFSDVLRGIRLAEVDDYVETEPELRDVTPRQRPAELGPDPLLAQLEAGPISQAIELELQTEREPVPIEETHGDDDYRNEDATEVDPRS